MLCRQASLEAAAIILTLELNGESLALRNVPAEVCPTCGEEYLDEAVVRRVLAQAGGVISG